MSNETSKQFTIEDALSINTFADRAPIRISADGRFLAYVIEDRNGEAVQEQIWVTEIDTGAGRHVLPEATKSWGAGWSPIEPIVAFVGDTGEGPRPWTHNAQTGETRQVSDAALVNSRFRFYVPQWLPDGEALVCALSSRAGRPGYDHLGERVVRKAPSIDESTSDGVTVRCWESPPMNEVHGGAGAVSDQCGMTLGRVDVATGTVTPLVEDIRVGAWAVSPDGRHVAYLQYVDPGIVRELWRLCVVPIGGGDLRVLDPCVPESYALALSWSPNSTRIAYCPGHAVAVVNLDNPTPRVLMPNPQGVVDEFHETPFWSPDGGFLLVTRHATAWRIPVDGGEPVDLLPDRGTLYVRHSGIASPGGGPTHWSPDGKSAIVEMRDARSGHMGPARIGLSGEGILCSALSLQQLSDVARFHLDISPARGIVTFVRQSATEPMDVWATDWELTSPRRITNLNPHLNESQFSTPRLLTWVGPDGREHHSAYYPPVDASEPPHPVVLYVYDGDQSTRISTFGYNPCLNVQLFTSNGYGVCLPDQVRLSPENRVDALRGMLACAVNSLIAEGVADPARIGIYGHSFGGSIVNFAITGLDCFAAAVCSTGIANYTSLHGTPTPSGDGGNWAGFVEFRQPCMGAPPWGNAQRYVEESPLFSLDRVTTPVLIVHGDRDDYVSQAWEMFNGLRRLNKPAALAIYQGEDHAPTDWRRPNVIDFWARTLAWFDRHMGTKDGGDD